LPASYRSRIAIDAAKQRGEPVDRALFFGPPGLGKTTPAILLAKEMGVSIRTTTGPVLERPGDLVGLLTGLRAGDILFIDEIHRLRPALEEFLHAVRDGGPAARRGSRTGCGGGCGTTRQCGPTGR